ncbi:MAG: hypothetical protein LBT79_06255 [Elusimicrobiota bacterium]|nr:hypothetical protein [Elusimicrobiota bacterium]
MNQIQNLKISSLEDKGLLLKKIISSVFFIFFFVISLSAADKETVVITGSVLNIHNKGDMIISEGNSKAVSKDAIIKSKKMTYNKKSSLISVSGAVEMYMKNDEGEPLEAFGDYGRYEMDKKLGALYGNLIRVKYYMKDSSEPMFMNSKEIYFDENKNTLKALSDVEIITTSGTIYSDNAVFYRDNNSVIVRKDIKRPVADIIYDDKKGKFTSDIMLLEKKEDIGSIKMRGKVVGKIEMEEERKARVEEKPSVEIERAAMQTKSQEETKVSIEETPVQQEPNKDADIYSMDEFLIREGM